MGTGKRFPEDRSKRIFVLYKLCIVKGVLDAARRSDRTGEWESVETNEEHDSSLMFQHEMNLYSEVVDALQI